MSLERVLLELWRLISMRRRYKQLLLGVLTEVDPKILDQAILECWGSYVGKFMKLKSKETIEKYLELMKEDLGL